MKPTLSTTAKCDICGKQMPQIAAGTRIEARLGVEMCPPCFDEDVALREHRAGARAPSLARVITARIGSGRRKGSHRSG